MQEIPEYKSMRVFNPYEYHTLQHVTDAWKKVCESYGYLPYKTSPIEPIELYKGKTSEEIVNEQMFDFVDKGERHITLRPEVTPSIARMVGEMKKHRQFTAPLKTYCMASVFRYEKPQHGRTREHIQLNVDAFGSTEPFIDEEVIQLAGSILLELGLKKQDFTIHLNDKGAAMLALQKIGLSTEKALETFRLLDKRKKMDAETFAQEMQKVSGLAVTAIDTALATMPASVAHIYDRIRNTFNVEYNPSMVRGFDYYTGIIFEIFATDGVNNRSVCGGGRYDKLVEKYSGEDLPVLGFGMGDVVLLDILKSKGLLPTMHAYDVAAICMPEANQEGFQKVVEYLRGKGISVSAFTTPKDMAKIYEKVEKEGARFILRGERDSFTLRSIATRVDVYSGTNFDEAITYIKK